MLNPAFEKTIVDLLRTNYDLEIRDIKELSNEKDDYRTFRVPCRDIKTYFAYPLRMTLKTHKDEGMEYYSFHIFSETINGSSLVDINEKIYPSVIQKALVDVKNEVPKFLMDSSFIYMLHHIQISLITGNYHNTGNDIVITGLTPIIDTFSNIFFFSPNLANSTYTFCSVNIKGDKLYIRPIKGYDNDPAFDKPVTFDDAGIKLFKASLFKCLLIFCNLIFCNTGLYNEADFMNLDYEAMKNYLLLLEMEKI